MPSSEFYGFCRWVKDDQNAFRKSVELEVTLASGVSYSDHASEDKPQPEVGDPVIWVVTYPSSADYATMLAGTCPTLPPSSSDLFTFCTRTFGGQTQVCDYYLPANEQWLIDFNAYLAYWFPALHAQVQSEANLSASMSRVAIIDAVAELINPSAPILAGG